MQLTNERYENIKREVARMYKTSGMKAFPIDPFELAVRLGIEVVPYSRLSLDNQVNIIHYSNDGCAVYADGCWIVRINDCIVPKERMTFTLFHEIGHIVLNHTQHSELADSEADFFAKYAICPPPIIALMGLKSSDDVQKRFKLSQEFSRNVWVYFEKWRRHTWCSFSDYEIQICNQFGYFPNVNSRMEVCFNVKTQAS